jgi:hypothetical protein
VAPDGEHHRGGHGNVVANVEKDKHQENIC